MIYKYQKFSADEQRTFLANQAHWVEKFQKRGIKIGDKLRPIRGYVPKSAVYMGIVPDVVIPGEALVLWMSFPGQNLGMIHPTHLFPGRSE